MACENYGDPKIGALEEEINHDLCEAGLPVEQPDDRDDPEFYRDEGYPAESDNGGQ